MVIFRKRVAGLSQSALERFVTRAKRAARLRGAVQVMLAGSGELRRLNRRFRGKDRATDVLSFPANGASGEVAGDIAVSTEIAAAQARRLGHTAAEEIKILVLHGVLHLAGYDHERDGGAMAAEELRLRKAMGLPVGLIERGRRARGRSSGSARRSR